MRNHMLLLSMLMMVPVYAMDISPGIHIVTSGFWIDDTFVTSSSNSLGFYSCSKDAISMSNYITCDQTGLMTSLSNIKINDHCRISTADLTGLNCINMTIRSDYDTINTTGHYEKKIIALRTVMPDNIIEYYESDGRWGSPEDTAMGIWLISEDGHFEDKLRASVQYLTNIRDNKLKCWPDKSCSALETAKTLFFLSESDTNMTRRLINDASIWLSDQQNIITDEDWRFDISTYENITCTFTYGGTTESISLSNDEINSKSIKAGYGKEFSFSCEDDIQVSLYDEKEDLVYSGRDDEISGMIEGPCWSRTGRWEPCDKKTTLYAVTGSGGRNQYSEMTKEWLEKQLKTSGSGRQSLQTEDTIKDTSVFLRGIGYADNIIEYIIYNQNNDGSWGDGEVRDRLIPTLYAIDAIRNIPEDSIYYIDSKINLENGLEWLTKNHWPFGYGDVKTDILYYMYFSLPFLLHNEEVPSLIYITKDSDKTIDFRDAATEVKLSENLKDIVSIRTEKGKVTFSSRAAKDGYYFGSVEIIGEDWALSIPAIVYKRPELNISYDDKIIVYGRKAKVVLDISKTDSVLACRINLDEGLESSEMIMENQTSVHAYIDMKTRKRDTRDYNGTLSCNSDNGDISIPFSIEIDQYPDKPFSVQPKRVDISSPDQDIMIKVTNNLEEEIDVSARTSSDYLLVEDFSIPPLETQEIHIENHAPDEINFSSSDNIYFESAGLVQKVAVDILITETSSENGYLVLLGLSILGIVVIGGIAYLAIWIKKKNKKSNIPRSEQKKETAQKTAMKTHGEIKDNAVKKEPYLIDIAYRLNDILKGDKEELEKKLKRLGIVK